MVTKAGRQDRCTTDNKVLKHSVRTRGTQPRTELSADLREAFGIDRHSLRSKDLAASFEPSAAQDRNSGNDAVQTPAARRPPYLQPRHGEAMTEVKKPKKIIDWEVMEPH